MLTINMIYVGFVILGSERAFHLLLGWYKKCLLPLVMIPLLVDICAIWIGVCLGPPYLSVILVRGFKDVSIGRWLVLYQTSVVIDLQCHILTIFADHHIYGMNFVYRTSIRHVSFKMVGQEHMPMWPCNSTTCVRKVYEAGRWGSSCKKWEGCGSCNGSRSMRARKDSKA